MRFDNLRVSPRISSVENRFRRAQPVPKLTTELRALHDIARVGGLSQRRFGPEAYWTILEPILDGSAALACERVSESAEGRPLPMVSFGEGDVEVLAWSPMHGDESTATHGAGGHHLVSGPASGTRSCSGVVAPPEPAFRPHAQTPTARPAFSATTRPGSTGTGMLDASPPRKGAR